MKILFNFFFTMLLSATVAAQKDYTQLVNPFIGTGGHGHTYPGASMPFGMMQLSPDTRMADWDGSSGYHYSDSVIYGFSHTHLSGTGIPDYCDVLLMPFTGKVAWDNKEYRSPFSHTSEKASPGYYEVLLKKNNIKARLTTSYRAGMHQYIYPKNAAQGSVLIDLNHRDQVLESYIEKINDHELRGFRRSRSWAQNQMLYFYIRFDQPIKNYEVLQDDGSTTTALAKGLHIKAAVQFDLPAQKTLGVKVGISGVSWEGAQKNLETEIGNLNFEQIHAKAVQAWNTELKKIDVQGGTKDEQTTFYTALYHTFLVPNIYEDVDGQFRGTDLKVHTAKGFTNYSVFSLWDTYRAYHPLMTILNQKRTTDWINTFLAQYQYGGMLPVWELSGNETFCMIGYHSVPVITDAYQKGIRGFDANLALKAMRSYAEGEKFGLPFYRQNGFLSNDKEPESVSKTVEYAYDDWCIAQFAKMTGQDSVYHAYLERAQNYKNLYDPQTGHMRGKLGGMWYAPFNAREVNNFYTEGNSWHYSFAAPQDVQTLIQLHGGPQKFASSLNELFTATTELAGRSQADVTGLIGQYAQGNEPSHHMAYLFDYVGMPWRTQELIYDICHQFYKNAPDGLIGNEDCGQMSAWYLFSAMGFYPVCPGSGGYELGTPLFDAVTIHLENGKNFTIKKLSTTKTAKYVKSMELNSNKYKKWFLQHSDLMKGGSFTFHLSDEPNKITIASQDLPSSKIDTDLIVPVPYIQNSTNKFTKDVQVSLASINASDSIFYMWVQPNIRSRYVKYEGPITIAESGELYFYAQRGEKKSKVVIQHFYKLPGDKSITVLSKVNPMYTAGGPDALIDGIRGTTNWRTGEWQSYFDQDFEAVVDLKQTKPVHYAGIHVLQDISPWILYPKELIVYTSDDGEHFTQAGSITQADEQKNAPATTTEIGVNLNVQTRYLKLKAINGGKLPAWHESAGNPSHIFIDEVIVR